MATAALVPVVERPTERLRYRMMVADVIVEMAGPAHRTYHIDEQSRVPEAMVLEAGALHRAAEPEVIARTTTLLVERGGRWELVRRWGADDGEGRAGDG